ncbi:MAG: DMT family transporter [Chloroflexota bacterium]|nr:DMT family transporter [Chloroflexota bacterium]MDQ5864403.1 DMT family transporter [Chloroflexota bacterium]
MRLSPRQRGIFFVLLAAGLWGTLGTFYRFGTEQFHLTPLAIVFWRGGLAALALGLVMGLVLPLGAGKRGLLRVRRADLPMFLAFGLLGVTAFYPLYIYSVLLVGVAVAVVLLYTAPIIVAVLAWRFLGESFDRRKLAALLLTFLGVLLMSRAYDPALLGVNALGVLCGLGSAFAYALYSILGKVSLNRGYGVATTSFYIYSIGVLGLLALAFVTGPNQLLVTGDDLGAWGLLLILALVQTLGAVAAYVTGLRYLEAGIASILATFEPVVATMLAFFVLHEAIDWPQMLGGLLVIAAVFLLQWRGST